MPHKLSIGMPVYNGERYLEQAVESILGQTYRDFELIIPDNASTDSSLPIRERLARRDPRIQLVRNAQNTGAAANFNRVFQLARGGYFKWACADDLAEPWLVERSVAVLDARPDVVLCLPRVMLIDENNAPIRACGDGLELTPDDVAQRFPAACSRSGLLNALQGVMRSSALRATPRFQLFRGTDVALMMELSPYGEIVQLDQVLLWRRKHSESASASETHELRQEYRAPKTRGRFASWRRRHGWERSQTVCHAPLGQGLELRRRERLTGERYWHRDLMAQAARQAMSYPLTRGRRPA